MSKVLAACLMLAAQTYSIPPAVLVGIYNVEGGSVGQQVANTNGTYDLGPMQINTLWVPDLANYWGVSETTAKRWVRDDPCTNMGVSAWILRQHLNETGSLGQAIAHYHSRTPYLGSNYRRKVVAAMEKNGLLRPAAPPARNGRIMVNATQNQMIGKSAERVNNVARTTQAATMATAQNQDQQKSLNVARSAGLKPSETRYAAEDMYVVVHNPINRDE